MSITQQSTLTEDAATLVAGTHWTGTPLASRWLAAARDLTPTLAEDAARLDRSGAFAESAFELLQEHHFMSMLVPAELGGGGATHAEACAVLAQLAHGCPSTSLALSMHTHLVAAQVWRYQRGLPAPVLEKVAANELVLVSTGASDWLESSGTATPVDGGYLINGHKSPSSGCLAGDVLVTSARWDDAPDGPQVVHASLPFSADGVSIDETWDTTGMRATGSHTVVLDNVFVPESAVPLVRPADIWHPVWSTVVGCAMPLIMATYVGVAESAADRAIELASRRAERPDVGPVVGRMLNHVAAAQDAVRTMVELSDGLRFDNDLTHATAVLTRKTNAADAAIEAVRLALEAGGGAAYSTESGIGRLMRDVLGAPYHPLPTAQQERFSGRLAMGLDPTG